MNNWGANHGAISYGHIGADLISLASMLRIPVYMHNVSNDRIFRPSAWAAFGTQCLESADYRACQISVRFTCRSVVGGRSASVAPVPSFPKSVMLVKMQRPPAPGGLFLVKLDCQRYAKIIVRFRTRRS